MPLKSGSLAVFCINTEHRPSAIIHNEYPKGKLPSAVTWICVSVCMSVPMADGMLRLRRLAADRLLISHSVLSLPSRLLVALLLTLRPLVRLFKSVQFPLRCGFLKRKRKCSNCYRYITMPAVELEHCELMLNNVIL